MFEIGGTMWPGLGKVVEETGELNTVLGKLMATGGKVDYFDGRDLKTELEEEMADVMAAIHFLMEYNPTLSQQKIFDRCNAKYKQFVEWHNQRLKT